MGIFSWFNWWKPQASYADWDDFWYGPADRSTAGQHVTAESSLRVSAVFACVSRISRTLASVPLKLYRVTHAGKELARNHPLWPVLHSRPNQWQTSFEWRQMLQGHLLLRGNAYSLIVEGPRGPVDQLIPLHPDRMRVEQLPTGRLLYHYTYKTGDQVTYNQDYIFHLRGFSSDGIMGCDPISLHRQTFGHAQAVMAYGSRFFENDARPGGIIRHPGILKSAARENIKKDWQEIYAGRGRHSTAVLDEGMDWKEIGLSNEQAQFLETNKFSRAMIASLFHVPPHLIGDLERATFSNIEHQSIEYGVHTMQPWFVCWEQSISRDLILAPEVYFAEFLLDGLLRGDIKSRYDAYALGRHGGWLSANEIRERENMNRRDDAGGDSYLDPMNMYRSDRPLPREARLLAPDGHTPAREYEAKDPEPKQYPVDLHQVQPGRYTNGKAVH